jgi:periplasmic protein TonB
MPGWFQRVRARMRPMGWPVILSLVGHIGVLVLLVLLLGNASPPPEPLEKSGIAVSFAPLAAQSVAALAAPEPVRPLAPPDATAAPPEETVPPLPAPQAPAAAETPVVPLPPQQTVTAETPPPPPPKPLVPRKPKYEGRRQETVPPSLPVLPRYAPAPPALAATRPFVGPAAAGAAMARPAAASVPGPDPSVNYRALISAWLESHKHYPDSARERGEEGSVGLRFRVDRFGRVIDYALLNSTGYADLDQGVEQMMNGAQLPPFLPGMAMSEIEVSVRVGFSLTR